MKEKEKYVGNTVRGEKRRKRIKSAAATLIIFVALFTVLIAVGAVNKTADTENLSDGLKEFIGYEEKATSFPVSFSTNDIIDVKSDSHKLYVLTKKFVTPVSFKGEAGEPRQLSYAQGALDTENGYCIVFDRLSNKYTFIDKKGEAEERQDKNGNQILNARVTPKGEVMLSLSSNSASSILHITDKKGEDMLIWSCAEEYIVSFDMSGDTVYCGVLGAYGGEIYTKIYVLELGESESVGEYTIPSSALIEVNHISSKKFSVLTKDALYICDAKKEEVISEKIGFSSELIMYSTDLEGNTAVVLKSKENLTQNLISVFTPDGETLFSFSAEDNIKDISLSGKEVYLLYDGFVKKVTAGGKSAQELYFDGRCVGIVTAGKKIYCYSLGGVEKAVSDK